MRFSPKAKMPRAAYRIRALRIKALALQDCLQDAMQELRDYHGVIATAIEEVGSTDPETRLAGMIRLACAISEKPDIRDTAYRDLQRDADGWVRLPDGNGFRNCVARSRPAEVISATQPEARTA